MSNENNYLFFHPSNTAGRDKNTVFVVVESRSILYARLTGGWIVQIDWFTGYSGIMTEH